MHQHAPNWLPHQLAQSLITYSSETAFPATQTTPVSKNEPLSPQTPSSASTSPAPVAPSSAGKTPSPTEADNVFYLAIPKSEIGRAEIKSLLGEHSPAKEAQLQQLEQVPFVPPVTDNVNVKIEPNTTSNVEEVTVPTATSVAANTSGQAVILDPSVVPEGEGMIDG